MTRLSLAEAPSISPMKRRGDVIIFGIDPTGAGKAAPQAGKRLADLGRDFQSSEQTRHRKDLPMLGHDFRKACPRFKGG